MAETSSESAPAKAPLDIDEMLARIRLAVARFPKAALFELADRFPEPFHILIGCIISIRTRDEVSLPAAVRLFEAAATPAEVAALGPARIDALIYPATFHEGKGCQIHAIAQRVATEFHGQLPCDLEILTSFRGVGPKCANLTLGIACPEKAAEVGIGVDIHVHRVTNRWGYVAKKTPEKTMAALQAKLPRRYFVEINALLVPFGKHICTGSLPRCSTCPVLEMCRQVGVTQHR